MAYLSGKGVALKLSISAVFTAIAQVMKVKSPGIEQKDVETTHLASTWTEGQAAGIPSGGEVTLELEWDPAAATHAALLASVIAGNTELWRVDFANSGPTKIAFSGFITKFDLQDAEYTNVIKASLTIKVTGAVTVTP